MNRKKKIRPKLRKGIIAVLVLLLLFSMGMGFWWFKQPAETEQQVPLYGFKQATGIDYRVYFLKNDFIPDESAGSGRAYITSLTDYIDTIFTYQMNGEQQAQISGEYQVTAALNGYVTREKPGSQNNEKELVPLFSKEDILIPATPFNADDSTLTVSAEFPLDYVAYADFISDMTRELRLTADLIQLQVTFHVAAQIDTPDGEITREMAPVMIIPVEGNTFMVEGQLAEQKEDYISETQLTPVPGVKDKRTVYAIAAVVFLLLLLGMLLKTTAKKLDPVQEELKKIMKKHGDWIAVGQGRIPALSSEKMLPMQSFDDLLKVADEAGQPILYEEDYQQGLHSFYVISELIIYHYILGGKSKDSRE